MKIKINNDADAFAFSQIAGLQNPRSLLAVVAAAASQCPPEENFTANIAKVLLPVSYRSNPSMFAMKILGHKDAHAFQDFAGTRDPRSPEHIIIQLFKQRKPTNQRWTHSGPSLKSITIHWLKLGATRRLKIPLSGIPPFFQSHPEQFKYQIKCETQTTIKILKLKTAWLISK